MSHSFTTHSRIAIVGAGVAGLACARALADAGLHVQIFEKSRGVSGRMSTRRGELGQCDHGAQYFTARDPAFRAQELEYVLRQSRSAGIFVVDSFRGNPMHATVQQVAPKSISPCV